MLGREALGLLCSVYPPLWSLKYAGIGKIVFQVTIVGVQKAGPTHLGERKNVLVIGSKQATSAELFLLNLDLRPPYLAHPPGQPPRLQKPAPEIAVVCKLGQVLAADHELPTVAVQPVLNLLPASVCFFPNTSNVTLASTIAHISS